MSYSTKQVVLAEFIGTFILVSILLGAGSGSIGDGSIFTPFLALFFALTFSFPAGGHVNPAVTVAMAFDKQTPWKQVPLILAAQFGGSLLAGFVVYVLFIDYDRKNIGSNSAANVFAPFPADYYTTWSAMYESFIGTLFFISGIFATVDSKRLQLPPYLIRFCVPLCLFVTVSAFGGQAGGPYNPAADLGPRILAAIFLNSDAFGNNAYFLVPLIMPILGGIAARFLYRGTVYYTRPEHDESEQELLPK